jgi:LmbE family N-acetylglucosaminyl deacetylase
MLNILQAAKPDIVFTQWPVDTHPDHQVTGLLALGSWVKMDKSFDLYFYEVNSGSETMAFIPTDYVDITSAKEKKKAAMYAHASQEPERTYLDFFKKMEEFRGLEAGVSAAEAFVRFKRKA